MENTIPSFSPEVQRELELEHIEYMITAGAKTDEILATFPRFDKCVIEEIVSRVSWFCWLSEDEVNTRTINGKDYLVRAVFPDGGKDIKNAMLKLAERKTMREMGIDMSLDFERDNPL